MFFLNLIVILFFLSFVLEQVEKSVITFGNNMTEHPSSKETRFFIWKSFLISSYDKWY